MFSVSYDGMVAKYLIRFSLYVSGFDFVDVCWLTTIFRINPLPPSANLINRITVEVKGVSVMSTVTYIHTRYQNP